MKRFAHVWGLVAACCLVGSSVGLCSDVVVWDTGPFCADCVTTNITFVSLEQFDSFTNYVYVRIWDAYGSLDQVTNFISLCESDLWRADSNLQAALDASSNVPFLTVLRIREARFAITNSADTTGLNVGAIGRLNKATEYATRASSDLQQVSGAFYNGVDMTRAQVATACESSGGCVCQCPDYTSLLQTIISDLNAIKLDVTNISGAIETIYYWLCDIYGDGTGVGLIPVVFNTFDSLAAYLPADSDVMNVPYILGEYLGTTISNRFALVEGLNNWYTRHNSNIWNRFLNLSALYGNDGISREIAEVTTFFRQLYSPESPPAGFDNAIISGWRDLALHHDFGLTNVVRVSDDGDSYLSVRLLGPHTVCVTNRRERPLWVVSDQTSYVAVARFEDEAYNQLIDILTNLAVNVQANAEANAEASLGDEVEEELESIEDDGDEPEYELEDPESMGFLGAMTNFLNTLRSIVPSEVVMPTIIVDGHLDFSSVNLGGQPEPTRSRSDIVVDGDAVRIGLTTAELSATQLVLLRVMRSACILIYYALFALIDFAIAKWIFSLGVGLLSLCYAVINGDLSALSRFIPSFLRESISGSPQ